LFCQALGPRIPLGWAERVLSSSAFDFVRMSSDEKYLPGMLSIHRMWPALIHRQLTVFNPGILPTRADVPFKTLASFANAPMFRSPLGGGFSVRVGPPQPRPPVVATLTAIGCRIFAAISQIFSTARTTLATLCGVRTIFSEDFRLSTGNCDG